MPTLAVRPQLGSHLTSFVVTGQAVAGNGALSDSGSPVILYGQRRGVSLESNVSRTEINHASSKRQNEVITDQGRSMTIEIFLVNNGTDPNPIETLVEGFEYIKVQWSTGTVTGSIETSTFYGVRGSNALRLEGRAEHIATLELGPCDIGQDQLTRVIS